ncbi:MAG: hypothetical protein ABIR17_05575 [Pseudolysinimonas sp.]|uniref:hypothetical protein n=1 Tax=Pseudolysinimonas sp. TaxID=2680009 RepID=UPI003265C1CD
MSTLRNPTGPQPSSVYWRRRLVVLLGLVAVIVIIVLIVVGRGNGGTPTPAPSADPSNTSVSTDDAVACDPAVITIEPVTDATSYPAGQQPQISMRITNRGSTACTFDLGTKAQQYLIVSGSDPIWNSKDCQTDGTVLPYVLQPNKPVPTVAFAWDRTRSAPSTCDTARTPVTASGATYRLSVVLGEVKSAGDAPFILK